MSLFSLFFNNKCCIVQFFKLNWVREVKMSSLLGSEVIKILFDRSRHR